MRFYPQIIFFFSKIRRSTNYMQSLMLGIVEKDKQNVLRYFKQRKVG